MDILTIFCQVDDFCQVFEPKLNEQMLADGKRKRIKSSKLSRSEVMTILIAFHRSGFRNLKTFYKSLIGVYYKHDFPDLVSYNRFVELQRDALVLLGAFMQVRLGKCSGISFIDSTKIAVCNNLRIKQNKVFKEIARRGKTRARWFYGFKIHLIVSDSGELSARHTRHRSVRNFYGSIVAGLIAYTFQEKKPSLELGKDLVLA